MAELSDQDELDPAVEGFIRRAMDTGMVWGLADEEGWALAPSAEDGQRMVLPLWSVEAEAAACATDDWEAYGAEAIALDVLLEHWLPGLESDGLWIGVDWSAELEGVEVPPLELQVDLETAINALEPDDGSA